MGHTTPSARFLSLGIGGLLLFTNPSPARPPSDLPAPPAPAQVQVRYDGDKVVRVEMTSTRDVRTMLSLSDDPWTCGWDGVSPGSVDFRIKQEAVAALEASKIPYRVLIEDVQALIDRERRAPEASAGAAGTGGLGLRDGTWFAAYQPLAAVSSYVDSLAGARPDLAVRVPVGTSLQSRPIFAIQVSGGPSAASGTKPVVFINGCQHAREWITVMATMYLADRLVNGYDTDPRVHRLVDAFEWILVPVCNPDGYDFTWTTQRLWRKNRRDNGDGNFGVDLNRNWGGHWGGVGTSTSTSSDLYRGLSAFSEPETQALSAFMVARPRLLFQVDVHSYTQLILEPYGFDWALPADTAAFRPISGAMQAAMHGVAGLTYFPGETYRDVYPASGAATDWVYDDRGAIAYGIELRDEGQSGFLLPADQIMPASQELLEGLFAATERLLAPVDLEWVDGQPTRLQAQAPSALRVRPLRAGKRPDIAAGCVLRQRVGRTGPFASSPLTVAGSDEAGPVLQGMLNAGACGSVVQYYVEVPTVGGPLATVPAGGASAPFEAAAQSFTTILSTDFETTAGATGWLASDPSTGNPDTAVASTRWVRGDPEGTVAQAEFDHTPLGGAQCFFTGVNARSNASTGDVDGGKTTLVSPLLNFAGLASGELSFWVWYSNSRNGPGSADDEMAVDISANGAAAAPNWVRALTLRLQPPIAQATAQWRKYSVRVDQWVPLTGQVRMRFVASDTNIGSYVEAALDDFTAIGLTCTTLPCPGDWNGNGALSVQDIFDFLAAYFGGEPGADVNHQNGLSVQDVFDFLAAYFIGC